jgi:hypothetical protein
MKCRVSTGAYYEIRLKPIYDTLRLKKRFQVAEDCLQIAE